MSFGVWDWCCTWEAGLWPRLFYDLCKRRPRKLPDICPNRPAVGLSPLCRVWQQAQHRIPRVDRSHVMDNSMVGLHGWWECGGRLKQGWVPALPSPDVFKPSCGSFTHGPETGTHDTFLVMKPLHTASTQEPPSWSPRVSHYPDSLLIHRHCHPLTPSRSQLWALTWLLVVCGPSKIVGLPGWGPPYLFPQKSYWRKGVSVRIILKKILCCSGPFL